MILKRICLAALIFSFGVAGTAQARTYALASGSGAQLHIGNGLQLPIQAAATALVTGTVFPTLLIPVANGAGVEGTTANTINQQITVPPNVLLKQGTQNTVGVFFSNPTLYAVATNIDYRWPAASAVFSENGVRASNAAVTFIGVAPGNTVRYSSRAATPAKRFGGAGAFALKPGPAAGLHSDSPVTIFAIANPGPLTPNGAGGGNPPCTHPAFLPPNSGGNSACIGALINAMPTGLAAAGQGLTSLGFAGAIVTTPGGVSRPNLTPNGAATPNALSSPQPALSGIVVGKFGAVPTGTVSAAALIGPVSNGLTNKATSDGFPFTTGKITISAALANGGAEVFIISGDDQRSTMGGGTLQMVAGAVSARTLSGPNANRAWLRLVLDPLAPVPAMSTLAQGVMIVLLMLVPAIYFGTRARRQAV
jgi:hypothetical protein